MMGQLARAHGSSLCNGPVGLERIFPGPQALATCDLAELPAAGGQTIKSFAMACENGRAKV